MPSLTKMLCVAAPLAVHTTAMAVDPPTPVAKHPVTSLPGWSELGRDLPSNMYTGFIDAGTPPSGEGKMYFHYWMVESEGNPEKDPVVVWCVVVVVLLLLLLLLLLVAVSLVRLTDRPIRLGEAHIRLDSPMHEWTWWWFA